MGRDRNGTGVGVAIPLLGLPALQVGAAHRFFPSVMQDLGRAAERLAR